MINPTENEKNFWRKLYVQYGDEIPYRWEKYLEDEWNENIDNYTIVAYEAPYFTQVNQVEYEIDSIYKFNDNIKKLLDLI